MKKRIILPSGKEVDADCQAEPPPLQLHICSECKADKVFPLEWEEHDEKHWDIKLRCPECETRQHVIAPQADCDLFDEVLDDGAEILLRDYKRLMTANLAEEIDRFVEALGHDWILPEDF